MTWLLRPGVGLARRDADHLQLGTDPPLAAVLPDSRAVRLPARRAGPRQPAHHASTRRPRRCSTRWSPRVWSWRPTRSPRDSTTAPAAGSTSTPRRRPPGVAAAGRRGRPPARPLTRGGVGGAGLERGRAAARAARRLDAVRHAAPGGPGRSRRSTCSVPSSSRAPPPACAASTPTSASTTRGGPGRRAGRHDATAAAVRARPGAARAGPGVGGARPRCRCGGRGAGHVVGHGRRSAASRRPSRRTAATSTAAVPGPRTSSTRPPAARALPGGLRVTSTRCRACPPSRAGGRANSCRSRSRRRPFSTDGGPGEGLRLVGLLPPAEVAGLHAPNLRSDCAACREALARAGAGYDLEVVPGSCVCTRDQGVPQRPLTGEVIPSRVLQSAGEGETRLLRCLLGLAAEPTGTGQLVAAPQLLRLSQARGHLRARQVLVHEIHLGAPGHVGLVHRKWLVLLEGMRPSADGRLVAATRPPRSCGDGHADACGGSRRPG